MEKNESPARKIYMIFLLLTALLITLALVNNIISDRENYRAEAISKVAGAWTSEQLVSLPELSSDNKFYTLKDCKIKSDIKNEYKKIGIFKIPVYIADLTISGEFINNVVNPSGKALLEFRISNPKGFISQPEVKILNQSAKTTDSTFIANIPKDIKGIPFEIKIKIRGADSINFATGADNIDVELKSDWADPSFGGDFLPSDKTITKDGFSAHWNIPKIAASSSSNAFQNYGVSFIIPVDNYRMTQRAVKYGALFLVLTFAVFFIFEIVSKEVKVHPVQYILIGASLVIFYLLLLSLSEFLQFCLSYLIASIMTISIIGAYSYSINKKLSLVITPTLIALYGFLYTLMNLESLSLLFGSLGLFIAIAVIMFATRNVKWYQ